MINTLLKYGIVFVLLILIQLLVLNNIQFSGYVNPYIYVMIILLMPVDADAWLLLIISFLTGIIIDIFSGSMGVHASATVLAGFVRPFVLRIISPRDGYESGQSLSMVTYGFKWYLLYSGTIVLIHHLALFYLEVFRFTDFFRTLLRVLLSSLFSLTFILLAEYYRKRK